MRVEGRRGFRGFWGEDKVKQIVDEVFKDLDLPEEPFSSEENSKPRHPLKRLMMRLRAALAPVFSALDLR